MKKASEHQELIDGLIAESFSKLKDKNVRIYVIPKWMFWMATAFVFGRFIVVNTDIRKEDKLSKKGLLAHELCHVEDSINRNIIHEFFMQAYLGISWILDTNLSRTEERRTDIRTIKKGYGKELLHLERQREKNFSKRKLQKLHSRGYLSSKEIKSLMRQQDPQ